MTETNPFEAPQADLSQTSESYAVESGFFSIRGRIGRIRYLANCLLVVFLMTACFALIEMLTSGDEFWNLAVTGFVSFLLMYPLICQAVKRSHDIGLSGWFSLMLFIPLVNTIYSLALALVTGKPGANQYGPKPAPSSKFLTFLIISLYVVIPLLLIALLIFIPLMTATQI